MTKVATLHSFFESFLKSYESNTVPDDAQFPYLTYDLASDGFGSAVQMNVSLWYRSTSWVDINNMTERIYEKVAHGILLKCDGGGILVRSDTPFAQNMGDPSDNMIRRKFIRLIVEYIVN